MLTRCHSKMQFQHLKDNLYASRINADCIEPNTSTKHPKLDNTTGVTHKQEPNSIQQRYIYAH